MSAAVSEAAAAESRPVRARVRLGARARRGSPRLRANPRRARVACSPTAPPARRLCVGTPTHTYYLCAWLCAWAHPHMRRHAKPAHATLCAPRRLDACACSHARTRVACSSTAPRASLPPLPAVRVGAGRYERSMTRRVMAPLTRRVLAPLTRMRSHGTAVRDGGKAHAASLISGGERPAAGIHPHLPHPLAFFCPSLSRSRSRAHALVA
jgi:hypothetical protein